MLKPVIVAACLCAATVAAAESVRLSGQEINQLITGATGMDHIHVDIGSHFVSIAGGQHWASRRDHAHDSCGRMARTSGGE